MVDELKSLKENLLRSVFSAVTKGGDSEKNSVALIRELINSLANIAGKGKDEIVQIISREIGYAVAGILREPINQAIESRKLKVTVELVPKEKGTTKKKKKTTKRKSSTSKR